MLYQPILSEQTERLITSADSEYALSRSFYVFPGWIGILRAFNFIADSTIQGEGDDAMLVRRCDCAILETVIYESSEDLALPGKCDPNTDRAFEVARQLEQRAIFAEPLIVAGEVQTIDACTNQLIITVPGLYRLRLDEPDILADGARVDFSTISATPLAYLPPAQISGDRSVLR